MGESISLPRTGNTALTFTGVLIDRFGAANPESPYVSSAPIDDVRRRLETYLYQADSGRYVVWVICRSEPGGRLQRSDAYIGASPESLGQQLRGQACMNAVLGLAAGHQENQAHLERELRAHWDGVVQLIEWSIQVREEARATATPPADEANPGSPL